MGYTILGIFIIAILAGIYNYLRGLWLVEEFKNIYGSVGKRILLVYSDSPNWKEYIDNNWIPILYEYSVILNWAERSKWGNNASLEVQVFRHWKTEKEYNPMAILFPIKGKIKIIRFFKAFRDYKHGKQSQLKSLEKDLFNFINNVCKRNA